MTYSENYGVIPSFKNEKDALSFLYDIRNDGRVVRRYDSHELKSSLDAKGYLRIRLFNPQFSKNSDARKTYKVHRLVAMMYLEDYNENLEVNHKNGNKEDNRLCNLEMVTSSQNAKHSWRVLDSKSRRERLSNFMKDRDCIEVVVKDLKTDSVILRYKSLTDAARDWKTTKWVISSRIKRGKKLRTPHRGMRDSGRDFRGFYFAKELG